jgi:nucleoside-diphosphate-sugar epimerase
MKDFIGLSGLEPSVSRKPILLTTGATGLVVSHVTRTWLEAHPEGRAGGLDLAPPDPVVAAFFAPVADRLTMRCGDVTDPALWDTLADEFAVTHMVHGAAVTSINRLTEGDGAPDLTGALPALEANVMGTARALAWAGRQPGLSRFVTISSGSVYAAEGPSPLPEDGYVEPEGLYPLTKQMGEQLTAEAARDFGLPAVCVRLASVYGPLDRETGTRGVTTAPKILLRAALEGREARLAGLDEVDDYIHAGDVGRAIAALLAGPPPRHAAYNIAEGRTTSLREVANLVARLVPGARWREAPPAEADFTAEPHPPSGRWGAYDISRLTSERGWRPRPLEAALADYRDWLMAQPY